MTELLDYLKSEAQKWPGASVSFHKDWKCDTFYIADKYFCLLGSAKDKGLVMTVKGLPEKNEELREQFSFVIPGYYTNKTHWNSIVLSETTFSKEELLTLLKESYGLVMAKLPKKVQDNLVE